MLRTAIAIVLGLVAYILLASVGLLLLRMTWPAYAAVEQEMNFDLAMQIARLLVSSASLIIAAWLTARIAPGKRAAPIALGVILLATFVPIHAGLWDKFPVWYHLTFLASLTALSVAGGGAWRRS